MAAAWDGDQAIHQASGQRDTAAIQLVRPGGHFSFRGGASDLPGPGRAGRDLRGLGAYHLGSQPNRRLEAAALSWLKAM